MRSFLRRAGVVALPAALAACASDATHAPLAPDAPQLATVAATGAVRISEIHYDNAGTDAGEAVEVTGPAGLDLTGWSIVRYNGNGGGTYTSPAQLTGLSGAIPATCGAEGVQVVTYAVDGLQNGSPDAVALVDNTGRVVEFLSYEGTFAATNGPAAGTTSTDIGASESSSPVGQSLQRDGFGGWALATSTFGACNDQPPPPYDGPTTVVIDELMAKPLGAESESWGEWFEVFNYGSEPVNLGGWKIRSGGNAEHTIAGSVVVAPGAYAVLGRAADRTRNGDVLVAYNYFSGSSTIWLDDNDWLVLRTPTNVTVDSVAWTTLAQGVTRALRDAAQDNADASGANWGWSTTPFGGGDYGTPNAPNGTLSDAPPPVPTGIVRVVFTGRDGGDPALPVGFEDQLFATGYTLGKTDSVKTGFTWASATPELASVDQRGVVRALGAGVARITATTPDGRTGVYEVPTRVAIASATAQYVGNTEFGVPTDADPSDDLLITRAAYTISWSAARNTPNWVSYDLEATHFGPEDRCDCFTPDPEAPGAPISTADYTGAGAYHGYGIDRGHLVRSSDRTAGSLDNAHTFYLSNIVPQAADNNQGPWNNFEQYLNNLARTGTKEIYVIAGVEGNKGTLKDEGRIVIPDSVWKVAIVAPRDRRLEDIDDASDFDLIAVDMPNKAGVRNVDWNTYRTTVDAVERATGYDLLAKLPDHVEWLVEAGLTSLDGVAPAQQLAILRGGIVDLIAKGAIADGIGSALLDKLAEAESLLAAGNVDDAIGALRALQNQVRALARAGRIPAAEGESITIFAGWIIDELR